VCRRVRGPLALPLGRTAALFIDLQEEHRAEHFPPKWAPVRRRKCDQTKESRRYLVEGFDAVLANVARLQRAARAAGVPCFHAAYVVDVGAGLPGRFHPLSADGTSAFSDRGSPLTALCPEVGPADGEEVLVKSEASALGNGVLALKLRARGVEWLLVAGVWTEACIAATVRDAVGLGFRVLLVKDACGSGSAAMHQTGILNLANRLYGGAVVDTDRACRLLAGETVEAWMVQGSVPLRFTYANAAGLYEGL
jgi:maleamate amidohydrolase